MQKYVSVSLWCHLRRTSLLYAKKKWETDVQLKWALSEVKPNLVSRTKSKEEEGGIQLQPLPRLPGDAIVVAKECSVEALDSHCKCSSAHLSDPHCLPSLLIEAVSISSCTLSENRTSTSRKARKEDKGDWGAMVETGRAPKRKLHGRECQGKWERSWY